MYIYMPVYIHIYVYTLKKCECLQCVRLNPRIAR